MLDLLNELSFKMILSVQKQAAQFEVDKLLLKEHMQHCERQDDAFKLQVKMYHNGYKG